MDDTQGAELVRLHANFDMESKIEHDERREIKNDRTTTINGNETLTVDKDRKATIKSNDKLDVTDNIEITAGKSITIKCGSSKITMDTMSITIEAGMIEVHAKTDLTDEVRPHGDPQGRTKHDDQGPDRDDQLATRLHRAVTMPDEIKKRQLP